MHIRTLLLGTTIAVGLASPLLAQGAFAQTAPAPGTECAPRGTIMATGPGGPEADKKSAASEGVSNEARRKLAEAEGSTNEARKQLAAAEGATNEARKQLAAAEGATLESRKQQLAAAEGNTNEARKQLAAAEGNTNEARTHMAQSGSVVIATASGSTTSRVCP